MKQTGVLPTMLGASWIPTAIAITIPCAGKKVRNFVQHRRRGKSNRALVNDDSNETGKMSQLIVSVRHPLHRVWCKSNY